MQPIAPTSSPTIGNTLVSSHMSPLSASIDKLMHEKDVLFVISAGNLYSAHANNLNPGISEHLAAGKMYPNYLDEDTSKIADPGTSSFAICVGSIAHSNFEDADYKSFATTDFISPFSRTGLGMWKTVKPDVVEYGGDLLLNKQSADITTNDSISCEVLNSTLYGAPAVGKDAFGTSFSTPKVTSIVAKLAKEHPTESAQMYRALIIQSARLPSHCFSYPTLRDIRYYGYGLPDLNRALNNTPNRITFIQNGHVGAKKADIYTINIPEELRGEGRGFKFLIEVTLAFTSRIRRTRKGAHSYLGTWLEWRSSKYNEGFNSFRSRTIEYLDNENLEETNLEGEGAIKWCLRENPAWTANGINRNNSTVQKSWVEVEPYQLADTFSIAVVGHIGWDKNLEHETPYALCVSFEALNPEVNIYNLLAEAQIQIPLEIEEEEIELPL